MRGSGSDAESNFRQILLARAEDVPELKDWLARDNLKYQSHDIQDEILLLYAHTILKQVVTQIREAKFFSIMLDETPDSARLEQVSICCRVVSKELVVSELFLGFYNTKGTSAEDLLYLVKDVFTRLQLEFKKLRGQCFDGASNMSGCKKGLYVKIGEIEGRAIYVHCNAHNLNLVFQDAFSDIPWAREFIGVTKEIIGFIRDSPKRLLEFKEYQDHKNSLIPYCPTR